MLALLLAFGGCAADEGDEVADVETEEMEPLGAEDDLEPEPMEPGEMEPMEPGEPEPMEPGEPESMEPGETAPPMGPDVEEPAAEPTPVAALSGEEVFAARCGTCHETSPMAEAGDRFDRATLEAFLRKQEAVDGEEHQVAFRGSPEEMETLLDWLLEPQG
jgi:mono/diheme cytochrome c family protein